MPGSGAAKTVQGEVIRISGRIAIELEENGGSNWDLQFQQMTEAWLMHIQSGIQLPSSDKDEATALATHLTKGEGDTHRMCELSTAWVMLNPNPIPLSAPVYKR